MSFSYRHLLRLAYLSSNGQIQSVFRRVCESDGQRKEGQGAFLAAAALLEDCKSHQPLGVRMLAHTNSADGVFLHLGSGLWMPEAQPLALLRRNIDRKPEVVRRVLTDAALRKTILGVAANDEKKAIKAFASHNAENALKTKPKVCVFLQSKQCRSRCAHFLFIHFVILDDCLLQSGCKGSRARWGVSCYSAADTAARTRVLAGERDWRCLCCAGLGLRLKKHGDVFHHRL